MRFHMTIHRDRHSAGRDAGASLFSETIFYSVQESSHCVATVLTRGLSGEDSCGTVG